MQSNAVNFDNVWQLRPSSSNSFSGETFATRQAFESNLRINWKCQVLFESAILHMSGRQNVGSSKQSYCQNSTGTGFIIFNSYIFLTYLQFTKIQKKYGLRDRCTSRGIFSNFGNWLNACCLVGRLIWFDVCWISWCFFMLHNVSGVYLHMGAHFAHFIPEKCKKTAFCSNWTIFTQLLKLGILNAVRINQGPNETWHWVNQAFTTIWFTLGIVSWKCP